MTIIKKTNFLFILSSFVIFILSTLLHFSYKWSNYNDIIGFFAPINESIFQHLKMFVFPTLIYYVITFIIFNKKYNLDYKRYLLSILITIILTSISILFFYYVLKYGFNISNMFIDIFSFVIGLFLSSMLSLHIYLHKEISSFYFLVYMILLVYILLLIYYLNYNPIKIDLFFDHSSNSY